MVEMIRPEAIYQKTTVAADQRVLVITSGKSVEGIDPVIASRAKFAQMIQPKNGKIARNATGVMALSANAKISRLNWKRRWNRH